MPSRSGQVAEEGFRAGAVDPSGSAVVVVGLGPIGRHVLRSANGDPRLRLESAVEPLASVREAVAATVQTTLPDVADLPSGSGVAILCTSSRFEDVAPVAETLMRSGRHVVTSCESMIAPQLLDPAMVQKLDAVGKACGRTVVSAGVNPGFAMDLLPAIATYASRDIRKVTVCRKTDIGRRRARLQEKLGVGISEENYERRIASGDIGHVGLRHSLVFLAACLGWNGASHETIEPVFSEDGSKLAGVRHSGFVEDCSGERRVEGLLEMFIGADEFDRIEVAGAPPVTLEAPGGIDGDEATVSTLLNAAASIHRFPAGLRTVKDLIAPGSAATESDDSGEGGDGDDLPHLK